MRALFAILLLALLSASSTDPRIKLSRYTLFAGDSVRVTCTVPRHPDNRKLVMGFDGYTSSDHQLDGDQARVTWEMWFTHVPCDAGRAFCEVTRAGEDKPARAVVGIEIAGCD